MGYFHTSAADNAWPAKSFAGPKTHTPGSRVNNLGSRYYNSGEGRWLSRDPIGEIGARLTISNISRRLVSIAIHDKNIYAFVRNNPAVLHDALGLMARAPAPMPAPPSLDPCVEAQKNLRRPANEAGALICHNGKLMGCVWNKDSEKYRRFPGLLKCAQLHEDTHFEQHPDGKCEPCKTYYYMVDPKQKPQDECAASDQEIACLKSEHKTDCGTDYDPDKPLPEMSLCEAQYWAAITGAEMYRNGFCNQRAGGQQ